MHIITKVGLLYPHTKAYEEQLQGAKVEYSLIDTTIFSDVEWDFINAMKIELVYDYMMRKYEAYKKANPS